jgi:hypothetical protein
MAFAEAAVLRYSGEAQSVPTRLYQLARLLTNE